MANIPMPLEKATNLIRDYKDSNYNASKTVQKNGYSKSYANSVATKVIDKAYKTVAKEIINSDNPQRSAMLFTGLSPEAVKNEYLKIILQDKDLTNKLKALLPLLKENGIVFEDNQTTQKPVVNLTMIQNKAINKDNKEIGEEVGQGDCIVSSIEPSAKNDQNTGFTDETIEEDNIDSIEEDTNEGAKSSDGGESEVGGFSTKVSHISGIESSDGRISGLIDVLTDNNG